MDGYSETPPINTSAFQAELDRACLDRFVKLRIRWSPALTVRRLGGATFKKYPDPNCREMQSFLKGYRVIRNGQVVGYKTVAGIETGSMDGLFDPDVEKVQVALPFYVIETRLTDDYAKAKHAQHRYIYPNGWKVDALGDFTEEHAWVWWRDVSEHRAGCCEGRDFCRGVYREPSALDLEIVRAHLWGGAKNPRKRDLHAPASAEEILKAARADLYEQEKQEAALLADLSLEMDEALALAMRPDVAPSVYVDLRTLKGIR